MSSSKFTITAEEIINMGVKKTPRTPVSIHRFAREGKRGE